MKGYPHNYIMLCPYCEQLSLCGDWKNSRINSGMWVQQWHKSIICPRCYEHLDTQQWNPKQWLVGIFDPQEKTARIDPRMSPRTDHWQPFIERVLEYTP